VEVTSSNFNKFSKFMYRWKSLNSATKNPMLGMYKMQNCENDNNKVRLQMLADLSIEIILADLSIEISDPHKQLEVTWAMALTDQSQTV